MNSLQQGTLYVAFDVEAAGLKLVRNSTLSVGACAVVRERLTFEEYCARGLVFYAELKPSSLEFLEKGMRVGCLHLECLEELRVKDVRYDPTHEHFDSLLVLRHMQKVCEDPEHAAQRFDAWLKKVGANRTVVPLADTVFFDSGHINAWLGMSSLEAPVLSYGGYDLKSLYQGYTGRKEAWLRELVVPKNSKPHKADHDAGELAQKARIVLFEKLKW